MIPDTVTGAVIEYVQGRTLAAYENRYKGAFSMGWSIAPGHYLAVSIRIKGRSDTIGFAPFNELLGIFPGATLAISDTDLYLGTESQMQSWHYPLGSSIPIGGGKFRFEPYSAPEWFDRATKLEIEALGSDLFVLQQNFREEIAAIIAVPQSCDREVSNG